MRLITRAAGADKIMSFGKKPGSLAMKFDSNSFPLAMGLILMAILSLFAAPLTALVIVGHAARRGVRMLNWAYQKLVLKEKAAASVQAAVPAKLIVGGLTLLSCCALAVYCCYWLETAKINSKPEIIQPALQC